MQTESLSLSVTDSTCTSAFQAGADRLTALQNDDGGWDWPLDDGNPASASPLNTVGPIAMGLAHAYFHTADADHFAALEDAGALLLNKTNNFSPSDGYLAAQLDGVFGITTYVGHVRSNFYDPLAAGTYNRNGAGTLYDTAGYVNLIRTARASQGIPNLAAWDIGMGLVGAASAGANPTAWVAGVKAEIDELDGNASYDVIGLAGAVYGLAFVNEDFDPTTGEHAAASSLADLAGILAGYQIDGGGFTWNRDYVIPYDNNETIQETAYAVLALDQFDRSTFAASIEGAVAYMESVQLATGGWRNWAGAGENNEVTGEALWGISAGLPGPVTSNVLAEPNPAPVGSALSLTAMVDNIGAGCSMIASAEYSLDSGPWMGMTAEDGGFDDLGEAVVAIVAVPLEAGIYNHTLCVRGTDYSGNTGYEACADLMLVVYDPDGGFVTGGGWIDSPPGAYKLDEYPSELLFLDTFDNSPPVADSPADGVWYPDRYAPSAFESAFFDGGNRLHVHISADDYLPHGSTFYNYQGRKYNLWTPLDTYITADLYIGSDWENNQRHASLWATTYDVDNNISGYPIVGFTTDNGFRIWTQDLDQDPSNGYQYGWYDIGFPEGFVYGAWYEFQAALTESSYRYYINDELVWTDIATYESILWANMMLQAYNFGEDYDVYWDNVGAGVMGPVGKASFGFVSKYRKGADTPTGNTEFVFQAADLNFHSSSYDWLVVTGKDYAKFKGSGAINGGLAPNGEAYKFMLWAGDDEPDTFQIKIWWEDANGEHVVYDNGRDQAIGGGSIVIHTKK